MEKDTGMVLFGAVILALLGFMIWRVTILPEGVKTEGVKTTELVRDTEGRVIQVIEK